MLARVSGVRVVIPVIAPEYVHRPLASDDGLYPGGLRQPRSLIGYHLGRIGGTSGGDRAGIGNRCNKSLVCPGTGHGGRRRVKVVIRSPTGLI